MNDYSNGRVRAGSGARRTGGSSSVSSFEEVRQRLIDALDEEHNPSYWGSEARDAEQLVNDFVHALAERIRNAPDMPQGWDDDYYRAIDDVADLIDPEETPMG